MQCEIRWNTLIAGKLVYMHCPNPVEQEEKMISGARVITDTTYVIAGEEIHICNRCLQLAREQQQLEGKRK